MSNGGRAMRAGTACLMMGLVLAGCVPSLPKFGRGDESESGPLTTQRIVERDVEAPEIFQRTDRGLWDGRPSLGGVWVAHPDTRDPERVIIRNSDNGQFVIGALFRRDVNTPGPSYQVSSDAAEALGMIAGEPATLNVTALRREDAGQPEPAVQSPGLPEAAPINAVPLDPPAAPVAPLAGPEPTPAPAPAPAQEVSQLEKPYIQIGIFSQESNAKNSATAFRGIGLTPTIKEQTTAGKTFYRVIVGPASSTAERASLLEKVKELGFSDAYFVRD